MVLVWTVPIGILLTQTNTKSQSVEFSNIENLNETSIIAQASTEIPDNETDDDAPESEPNKKDDEVTWAELLQDIKALFFGTLTFILGIVGTWIKGKNDQFQKLGLNLLDSISWFNPCKKVNSILVVGKGGVGKTTLVKRLTGNQDANNQIRSGDYQIYQVFLKQQKCNFYISDYAGEKLEDLLHNFIKQQQYSFSPMRYSCITSLILLVDLFEPPALPDQKVVPQDNLAQSRIDENDRYWNEDKLSMVLKLTNNLKYVCLLINKRDLLRPGNLNEQQIQDKYGNLFIRLRSLAENNKSNPQLNITRKVFSLDDNLNDINGLIQDLVDNSYSTKEWEKLEVGGRKGEKTEIKKSTK